MTKRKPRIDLPYDYEQGGQYPSTIITPGGHSVDLLADVPVPAVKGAGGIQAVKVDRNYGTVIIVYNEGKR